MTHPTALITGQLIVRGGREKFLAFVMDQRLSHAREVYGAELDAIIADVQKIVTPGAKAF